MEDDGARELPPPTLLQCREREFFIDNLLVRIHYIIVMIKWTGLAPWEFEFPLPGSLTSTFLCSAQIQLHVRVSRSNAAQPACTPTAPSQTLVPGRRFS